MYTGSTEKVNVTFTLSFKECSGLLHTENVLFNATISDKFPDPQNLNCKSEIAETLGVYLRCTTHASYFILFFQVRPESSHKADHQVNSSYISS